MILNRMVREDCTEKCDFEHRLGSHEGVSHVTARVKCILGQGTGLLWVEQNEQRGES